MPLQKTITLPNTMSGNYVVLGSFAIDAQGREASAYFNLFASAAAFAANPQAPLCMIAALNLSAAKFDQYLAPDVLAAVGGDIQGQLYAAAKAEFLRAGGGLTNAQLSLADATDV